MRHNILQGLDALAFQDQLVQEIEPSVKIKLPLDVQMQQILDMAEMIGPTQYNKTGSAEFDNGFNTAMVLVTTYIKQILGDDYDY